MDLIRRIALKQRFASPDKYSNEYSMTNSVRTREIRQIVFRLVRSGR